MDYQSLREHGICVSCWRAKADAGVRCKSCQREKREKQAQARARAKEKNACSVCHSKPATTGYLTCSSCRARNRKAARRLRQDWHSKAMCSRCGGEIPFERDGRKTCGNC